MIWLEFGSRHGLVRRRQRRFPPGASSAWAAVAAQAAAVAWENRGKSFSLIQEHDSARLP
jgi:hypothetical protein